MKRSSVDALFSLYIRSRDHFTCVRCKTKYDRKSKGLHCSHFYGRGMKSVRFDPDNCDSLCHGCHRWWEKEDREGYRAFKIKQLGQRNFDLLTLRAHTPKKPDYKLLKIYYTELLKEYVR